MSEIEKLQIWGQETARQMGESMETLRISFGLPDARTVGYVGNRCGWYPAKPKRRRKGAV